MLEVAGSRVFVDDICNDSNGIRVGGDERLNDEEICGLGGGGSTEAGVKRESGVGDVVGESGAKESGVSGVEASSRHGLEAGFGGPLVEEIAAMESLEQNNEVIASESVDVIVVDMSAHENGVRNDEVLDVGIENRVEGSNADVGSMGGETQVVHGEDIEVVSAEEDLERGLPKDDAERGSEIVSGAGCRAQSSGTENVEPSTVVSGTVSEETQVVEEQVDRESENNVAKECVKGAEQGREMDSDGKAAKDQVKGAEKGGEMDAAGEDAHQDVETRSLGTSLDETLNPGCRIAVAASFVKLFST